VCFIADIAGLGLRISKQNIKDFMVSFFQGLKANNFKCNVILTITIVLLILWVNLFLPPAVQPAYLNYRFNLLL
jgi:hypothetical protein